MVQSGPNGRLTVRDAAYTTITMAFPAMPSPQPQQRRSLPCRAGALSSFSVTDATAFSPTDVTPLARWAKAAMTLQAATSLVILGLVIARAVTILK
jgi:hypothetical protein